MAEGPVRVEIRYNGRVYFANMCYSPTLEIDGPEVRFRGQLIKGSIGSVTPPPAPPRSTDPRDGDEVIHQVHSGKREPAKRTRKGAAR